MVFEKFTPKPCRNHADRTAVYYETASGLYFCADCRNGLSNATSNDLRALAGLKPLDYSAELSPKQLEEEKVRERERTEREHERDRRLEREAERDKREREAKAEEEKNRLEALDKAERDRLEALKRERDLPTRVPEPGRLSDPVPVTVPSNARLPGTVISPVPERPSSSHPENLTALSDTELKDRIARETNPSWKAQLVEEQNRRSPKENLSFLSDQELKNQIAKEQNPSRKALLVEEQNRRAKLKPS